MDSSLCPIACLPRNGGHWFHLRLSPSDLGRRSERHWSGRFSSRGVQDCPFLHWRKEGHWHVHLYGGRKFRDGSWTDYWHYNHYFLWNEGDLGVGSPWNPDGSSIFPFLL